MKEKTKLENMIAHLSDKSKSEQVSLAECASKLATEQRKTAELVRILICYQLSIRRITLKILYSEFSGEKSDLNGGRTQRHRRYAP